MKPLPVLIVEDDASLREALTDTLELSGYEVLEAADGAAALQLLEGRRVGLVVSDVQMKPMDGEQLLREIKRRWPDVPVLLMTAYGMIERAVEAMRAGACNYLPKPFEPEALVAEVARWMLPAPVERQDEAIARDPASQRLLELARRVAGSEATVLITGESGVGKEVLARFVHRHSPRAAGPFVAINCAAIPENLLEATLFGYEKGAFTGASAPHAGKFEQAQGGTLLLDEISEMPPPCRPSCCVFCRSARSSVSAARNPLRWMCASWRRRIAICRLRYRPAASVRTCTTGSTSFRCMCRRCAAVRWTSYRWHSGCCSAPARAAA